MHKLIFLAAVWAMVMFSQPAQGQATPTCPLAATGVGSNLATQVCYRCFFPIQIAGTPTSLNVPVAARPAGYMCYCPSVFFGMPSWGVVLGMWLPIRMVESVRIPFCSSMAGGVIGGAAGAASMRMLGGYTAEDSTGGSGSGFFHFHWFAFPLGVMMDMNIAMMCKSNEAADLDLLYMSELDPTWHSDELAMLLTPEASLFANPIALTACLADAAAASAYQPLDALFWCAGAWGEMYPHTGNTPHGGGPPQMHSLIQTRAIAAMHRRGLANQMMGFSAVCANHPNPIIPKSQYKLQTVRPIPELINNHWIGATTLRWGEHRNIPVVGEDWVSILWGYEQCCLND